MTNHITTLNPQDLITTDNNQIRTTSLKVAEAFGKRHAHIVDKIKSLNCSPEFASTNFSAHVHPVDIGNGAKRDSAYYEMTKDGFMFLVMGFTGKKAATIKEAYINAFNWMADQLQQQYQPPQQQITSIPTYSLPHLPPHQIIVNRQDLINVLHMNNMARERWRNMEAAQEALINAQSTMRSAIGSLHDAVIDNQFHEIGLRRALDNTQNNF